MDPKKGQLKREETYSGGSCLFQEAIFLRKNPWPNPKANIIGSKP